MSNQLWKPDKVTRSAISRGNRKEKEFRERMDRAREERRAERKVAELLDMELIAKLN